MSIPDGYYEDLLRQVVAGRRWIVGFDVLVPASRTAAKLVELGATSCLAIAGSRGTGALAEGIEGFELGASADDMMGGIRASEAALDDLPPWAVERIDAWDPEREARAIRPLFSAGRPIHGRPTWGGRDPRWIALEDKTIIDALWDAAGLARAPSRVVPLTREALAAASRALDRGHGVVWAGDNRSGWHGGATYTRWVVSDDEAEDARVFLAAACDTARVMPFLEGVPCSVHGIVFEDHVVALRPCEMMVLRDGRRLVYAAASTYWDPPGADRVAWGAGARGGGGHLRETLGYRGVFTIDGVMTADGFLPTELNPRYGAAIGVMTRSIPGLSMFMLHCAIIAREPLDWRPRDLEALILSAADGRRDGRAGGTVPRAVEGAPAEGALVWTGDAFRAAAEGETPDAKFTLGPNTGGTYFNVNFPPERTPVGPPLAPRAAAALRHLDARFGLGLGDLRAAPDVRA